MQILTKDSVTVFVNAIMYYRVKDPISAVTNVDDYAGSAQALAATTLRQGWVYYLPEELYTIKIQGVSKKGDQVENYSYYWTILNFMGLSF